MAEEKEKLSKVKSAEAKSEGGKKEVAKLSKKAQEILKAVEEMSVLELNELVKALEEKFGVTAAVPVASVSAVGRNAGYGSRSGGGGGESNL